MMSFVVFLSLVCNVTLGGMWLLLALASGPLGQADDFSGLVHLNLSFKEEEKNSRISTR